MAKYPHLQLEMAKYPHLQLSQRLSARQALRHLAKWRGDGLTPYSTAALPIGPWSAACVSQPDRRSRVNHVAHAGKGDASAFVLKQGGPSHPRVAIPTFCRARPPPAFHRAPGVLA